MKKVSSILLIHFILLFRLLPADTGRSEMGYEVMSSYGKDLKEQGFLIEGKGGSFLGGIDLLSLDVVSQQEVNLGEARKIYIGAVKNFITKVNENKKARPFLLNFPFNENNIKLSMSFMGKDSKDVKAPYIGHIFTIKGIVYYSVYDPIKCTYEDLYMEPYQEALKIVNSVNSAPSEPLKIGE